MNDPLQKSRDKLYYWIAQRKESALSYTTIQVAVQSLCNQYHPELAEKIAWSRLFLPLLRSGVVFFSGAGRYRLSPTVQLQGKRTCLLVNTFNELELLPEQIAAVGPGQYLLPRKLTKSSKQEIPVIPFALSQLLARIPPLKKIIHEGFREFSGLRKFPLKKQGGNWINHNSGEEPTVGIYKSGAFVFSPKYLVMDELCYDIPSLNEHPDAYTLAEWACKISKYPNLTEIGYDRSQQRLQIKTPFFPIELEKLLHIHTVLSGGQPEVNDQYRSYLLPPSSFTQLNRIFHHKIAT